ncbi:MAG: hypothetical protein HYV07_02240 [Deltaproteobacteria bacterium]|nr:hypothetical protein [Deltaproteobacteria bacterium]
MKVLPDSWGLEVFKDDLVYLEAALLASEATQDLAPAVAAAIEDLSVVEAKWPAVRRVSVQAAARVARADSDLDETLRDAHSALLAEVRQDRSHPAFRAVYDSPISDIVRHALPKQVVVARSIADKLGLSVVPEPVRTKHVPPIRAAIARGEDALERRREADVARMQLRVDERAVRDETNAVRTSIYSALLLRAPSAKTSKAWADGFFARHTRSPSVEDVTDEPTPAPAPE